jgi:hypothetical protein
LPSPAEGTLLAIAPALSFAVIIIASLVRWVDARPPAKEIVDMCAGARYLSFFDTSPESYSFFSSSSKLCTCDLHLDGVQAVTSSFKYFGRPLFCGAIE